MKLNNIWGKQLNACMHVNSLSYNKGKRDESKCFGIDCIVRKGCIMCPWFFNVYINPVMKEVKMRTRRGENRDYPASCMRMNWFYVTSGKMT